MRCPNCNQWNRASLPRCFRCGTELAASAPVSPSWRAELKDNNAAKAYIRVDEDGGVDTSPDQRDVLAAEMAELKARKDDGAARLNRLRRRRSNASHYADEAPAPFAPFPEDAAVDGVFSAYESSQAHEHPEADDVPESSPRSTRVSVTGFADASYADFPEEPAPPARDPRGTRVIHATGQWQDSRTYDPIVDDMRQNNVFMQPVAMGSLPATPSRRSRTHRTLTVLTTLLVIVVLGLLGIFAYGAVTTYMETKAQNSRALVTASMMDDLAAHTILIPGEEGQMISIKELHKSYEVIGGYANIVIPDYQWYDGLEVITEETMSVTLTPYVQTSGGTRQRLDPIVYDITIPLSPVTLVTPETLRTEVTTAMYSMKFAVRPGSTVYINGVDMSDAVDETGSLTYNATVQPIGDNVYVVDVRSPYCRNNSMEVVLFRQVQEIPLDLAATTYTSTSLSAYEITATTLPGAEIDVLSPHTDLNITNLNTTGEFSFFAVFDHIGDNTVSIQATYPGKKTSRVDYTIYYLPNQDVYTRKAWSLSRPADYAELVGNIAFRAERTQIYVAMGEIDHFVTESPQMAVMYCSEDGLSQPVLLENRTKTTWKKGVYYRIYADVYSTYNGMPWLIARYTYLD